MNMYSAAVYLKPVAKGYYRTLLTEKQQKIYDLLFQGVRDMQETVQTDMILSDRTADMNRVYHAFTNDQPWFFYLQSINYSIGRNGTIFIRYRMSQREALSIILRLDQAAGKMIKEAYRHCRRSDRIGLAGYVHDALAQQCSYKLINDESYNIIGPLLRHQAVCQGIAETYKILLNAMGIGCIVVSGIAHTLTGPGKHAWNVVLLNGDHYYADVTADLKSSNGRLRHSHALMNEKDVAGTYELSPEFEMRFRVSKDNWFTRLGKVVHREEDLRRLISTGCRDFECMLAYKPKNLRRTLSDILYDHFRQCTYSMYFDDRTGYLSMTINA